MRRSILGRSVSAALVLILSLPFVAEAADSFRPHAVYDPDVPEAVEVLGFELGEKPVRYEEIMLYAGAVAETSPRALLRPYATSHEGRELVYLVISSEANLARLDEIRSSIEALADPRHDLGSSELDELLGETPAVAYCAFSIHGDELSGVDAGLRLVYELAAGRSEEVENLLNELVILVDPTQNPDGRERILSMISSFQGSVANPDPDALSHQGFWPWGRGNHYFFDLNRDWFAQVHPESRGRAEILSSWHPQLVIDAHEMGSSNTFLFSPPRDPFNPNWPKGTLDWAEVFAADLAEAFDTRGWSYYTRGWFEMFFPGYGSALGVFQGAVGILYEQARTAGQPTRKPSGRVSDFREAVSHQFESTMANLNTAAMHRRELMLSYRSARQEAIDRGRKGPVRAFYFEPRPDENRARRLADKLTALGIEVERLDEPASLDEAHSFFEQGGREIGLAAGSFRVRLDQPDGLLAKAILEPHTVMADSSLAEERSRIEKLRGSRIYDTTAWSLLLASGLDSWWSPDLDRLDWHPWNGDSVKRGGIAEGSARYGWIIDGASDASIRLVARLLDQGFKVRAGEEPFILDGRSLPRGSFLLRKEDNPAGLSSVLHDLSSECGVDVLPLGSARIQVGPDLGGQDWRLLESPRIAIAAGQPLNYTSVGAAWHLLDREFGVRVSLVDVSRLWQIDLDRYNVLVLPAAWGGADGYAGVLGDGGQNVIRDWVLDGGTLVSIGSATQFLADAERSFSQVRPRAQVSGDFPAPRFGLKPPAIRSLERMQGHGLDPKGEATNSEGEYRWTDKPEALGIPGPGSPVLGPGLWDMLEERGKSASERELPILDPESYSGESDAQREKQEARLRRFLPSGSLLRIDLDEEHWLAWGSGGRIAGLAGRRDALISRDPVETIGRWSMPERLHLGGLLWPEAAGYLSQTAFLTREGFGRGQLILFAEDPNFRGYFWGTQRLFLNAVLLGPGMGTRMTIPW